MNDQTDATREEILAKFSMLTEEEQKYIIDFASLLLDKERCQSAEREAVARGMTLSEYAYREYQKNT